MFDAMQCPEQAQQPQQICLVTIAHQLKPIVIKWNSEFHCSGVRGATEWKQLLKNNFVYLTQFASDHPGTRKKWWKADLTTAATQAIAKMCPNWPTNPTERVTYNLILQAARKTSSPRQDWLREKAYTWLKCLPPELQTSIWYPDHAIEVAHQLFLNGSGKFHSFMKHLKKSN